MTIGRRSTYRLFFSRPASIIFQQRHLINPVNKPRKRIGWTNLMQQRGLTGCYRNTFILAQASNLDDVFTEAVGNGNHESYEPISIVDFKRNRREKYYVAFDGDEYVEVTLDNKGRPFHFVGYENVYQSSCFEFYLVIHLP